MKIKIIVLLFSFLSGHLLAQNSINKLILRVTNNTVKNIIVKTEKSTDGKDFFELIPKNGKLIIKGNNAISQAVGFNWYLKYVAGIHISWNNLRQSLPSPLPLPTKPIRKETNLHMRYYLNYCTFSYSMAFWDWPRWEKEIDWMALHGINLCLSITGSELVWYNLLKKMGYSVKEINEFISGPAYMAWWQMNNLEGWGGPNPSEWYQQQGRLQKKILSRMRELGIEPALPGFAGMVPRNIGKKLKYNIADPGTWCTFNRPAFLSPTDPNFNTFADKYYKELTELYGKANYYAIDPFHEGGSTKGVDLDMAGRTIMAAMKRTNPKATWLIQAWQANPRKEMIGNLKKHDLLILDLYSEKLPQWGDKNSAWYRPNGYEKHDWLYCMLLNFGGRVGLHGRMDNVINGFYKASEHPLGKTLTGVGATPEGIENNPVMFELLYELPWRGEKFTKEEWMNEYIKARYSSYNDTLAEAWKLLASHPYNAPTNYPGEGTVESLFCARPSINPNRVSTWGAADLFYNWEITRRAAKKFLSVANKFKNNDNFKFDLVDILRQSIADKGNHLSREIEKAYRSKNINQFKILTDSFLLAIRMQDKLLSTRKEFKVGNWLKQARSLSKIPVNRDLYEWNARTLITVWGNKDASENGGLHDYSHREWNGLLSDLYYKRWKLFFDNTIKRMKGENIPPENFYEMEEDWTHQKKSYPSETRKDVVQTATEVYEKVFGKE